MDRLIDAMDEQGKPTQRRKFRIAILNAPFPNAMALPDGRIYITVPMLRMVTTESQLAGVLGHEIGHAMLNHTMKLLDQSDSVQAIFSLKFGHDNELEADAYGFNLAEQAGYSPKSYIDWLKAYAALARRLGVSTGGFFDSHPAAEERIKQLESLRAKAEPDGEPYDNQSSPAFVAMKDALSNEVNAYMPFAFDEEEPPRFKSGKSELDRKLLEVSHRYREEYDLEEALDELLRLSQLKSLSTRERQAVELWLGRIDLRQDRYEDAIRRFDKLLQEGTDFEAPTWLKVWALIDERKFEPAKQLWKDRSYSDACQRSFDCLYYSAFFAKGAGADAAEQVKLAERFRKALLAKGAPISANEGLQLSELFPIEVYENSRRKPEDRIKDWRLPPGYRPSPAVQDRLILEQSSAETKTTLDDGPETSQRWNLSAGPRTYTGNLAKEIQGATSFGFGYDVENWPWAFGADFRLVSANESRALMSVGLRIEKIWGRDRLRLWTGLTPSYDTLDTTDTPSVNLTTGPSVELSTGIAFRLNSTPRLNEFWIELGGSGARSWYQAFSGHSGTGGAYEAQLKIVYRYGAGFGPPVREIRPDDRVHPPVYF